MSSEFPTNPYQTPQASVETDYVHAEGVLAGRATRLGAMLLDWLVATAFGLPGILLVVTNLPDEGAEPSAGFLLGFAAVGIGYLIWLLITYRLVKENGWTIGKRALNIRVQRTDGTPIGIGRIFWLRNVIPNALGGIPMVGPLFTLVDHLFIFGGSQRCVHDYLADTMVVRA